MSHLPIGALAASLIATLAVADPVKTINIAVVDAQGQPVPGLHAEDFQLTIDGKPRSIAFSRFTCEKPAPSVAPQLTTVDSGKNRPYENSNRLARGATVVLLRRPLCCRYQVL